MKPVISLTAEHIHSFIEYIVDNILDQVFIQISCHQLFDLYDRHFVQSAPILHSFWQTFFPLVVYCFQLLSYWQLQFFLQRLNTSSLLSFLPFLACGPCSKLHSLYFSLQTLPYTPSLAYLCTTISVFLLCTPLCTAFPCTPSLYPILCTLLHPLLLSLFFTAPFPSDLLLLLPLLSSPRLCLLWLSED